MPAMKMRWSAKDRSMLNSAGVGDEVDFTPRDDNGSELAAELKRSPAAP